MMTSCTRAAGALVAAALGAAACTSHGLRTAGPVAVVVSPGSVTLYPGQSFGFTASVSGTVDRAVDWSVTGGAAGGTITPSGFYSAPASVGVYEVRAVSRAVPASSGTASVTVIPAPPGGVPMTTAHRAAGVAPLAVFFDAVNDVTSGPSAEGSTFAWSSGVFQPADYEGTLYAWSFGDPGSGVWTTTSRPRNTATGYTAAHVYETPGTYTATLTITDVGGTVRTYAQTIDVAAFSGTTFYVAASGSDASEGTSTAAPFRTVDRAMTAALATDGPVRVLLNRGDHFAVTAPYRITKPGPGIIGAYGTGDRPVLTCADLGEENVFSPRGTGSDWRIMDLELVGPGPSTATGPVGPPVTAQGVDTLVLRVRARGWNVGIGWGDWTPIFATPHDGMAIVDCEVTEVGSLNAYVGGRRLMLLGNDLRDSGNTHVLRVWQAHKAVISNNNLLRPHAQRHCLKLHGPGVAGTDPVAAERAACPATRWVTIGDNVVQASDQSQWSVSIGPQDSVSDERVSHVVYERNRHTGSPSLVADVEGSARAVMIRNNVFDGTGAGGYTGILWIRRGIEPPPDDLRVYGNTLHKGGASSELVAFDVSADVTGCRIRNNLVSYGSGAAALFGAAGATVCAADHNVLTTAPGFSDVARGDFSLAPGSPAIDAGAALGELREDHARSARPLGAGYDVGAYESR